MYRAFP
jgi:hypothetical protein